MANLSKPELFNKIVNSVRQAGWDVAFTHSKSAHPFRLTIYQGHTFIQLLVYIWNISHGGNRRASDEYRIQVKTKSFLSENPRRTLVLGYWDEGDVFAGWDISMHQGNVAWSASFQIKLQALTQAHTKRYASWRKSSGENAVAFSPEMFCDYAQHSDSLHKFGKSNLETTVFQDVTSNMSHLDETAFINKIANLPKQRKIALTTVRRSVRDQSFRSRVLTAYGHRCSFCGIQLELIDAAHIVPVSESLSTDETSNGIALCSLHHRAYDSGLITVDPQYKIFANATRMNELRELHRDGGKKNFTDNIKTLMSLPPDQRDHPHESYIRTANKLRGWQ